MLLVHCDGSIADKNPGGRGFAGWVIHNEAGERVNSGANALGSHPNMSNNIAEYGAVLAVMNHLVMRGYTSESIRFHIDSQLVVNQLGGRFKCTRPSLMALRDTILFLARKFPSVEYVWIPREQNKEADKLSKSLWK